MFDKFEARCALGNWKSAYRQLDYQREKHHRRYKEFVNRMPRQLTCQECGGSGSVVIDRIDWYDIYGSCGWCEGTGLLTPWYRGQWLRIKKEERKA